MTRRLSDPLGDESQAWLEFLAECRQVLLAFQAGATVTLGPAYATAMKLRTQTGRTFSRVMLSRLAERVAEPRPIIH